MEENKNIESNEKQKNSEDESLSSASEAVPEAEQSITHNPPVTEQDMEVHHHSHENHGKKNWKTYFWEFLMLFLAVTLGFFVENQREHYIEHTRAKEFAALMYEDLKKDTLFFREGAEQFARIMKHQDSLSYLLQRPTENPGHYSLIKHWINGVWALSFTPHQATYEQMKNSGSLRYIKNIRLINSMQDYYNNSLPNISHYHRIQSELTENRVVPFIEDHIDYREADFLTSTIHTNKPALFDWNERTAIKLYNMMLLLRDQNNSLTKMYDAAGKKAIIVMQLLQKEYHLK